MRKLYKLLLLAMLMAIMSQVVFSHEIVNLYTLKNTIEINRNNNLFLVPDVLRDKELIEHLPCKKLQHKLELNFTLIFYNYEKFYFKY